jgi:DNA transposition AAA+ family ATPase
MAATFIETREYRRFREFCDACRDNRYIGLCYGRAGVGKTLSARHYANWDEVDSLRSDSYDVAVVPDRVMHSDTILYTTPVVNSPAQIDRSVYDENRDWMPSFEGMPRSGLTVRQILNQRDAREEQVADPTRLILVDEADRLRRLSLEQIRDIFDRGGIGVVLIGMPGLEKKLARYSQLYSRVGFVHEFRPLNRDDIRDLLRDHWRPADLGLPDDALTDEEGIASIIRITGVNFRLLERLLTQIARILELNGLKVATPDVVEAARVSLVIGPE